MFSTIDFIFDYMDFIDLLKLLPDGIGNTIYEILQFIFIILFGEVHILPVL